MTKSLNKDVLEATLATPLTREQLLQRILDRIELVNFREEGGVSAEVKISMRVYKVITIRKLLEIARTLGHNLCKKNDMCYVFNRAYWVMLDAEQMKPFLGEIAEKMGVPYVLSGNSGALLHRRPLRTQHATFAALGSSLGKGTLFRYPETLWC